MIIRVIFKKIARKLLDKLEQFGRNPNHVVGNAIRIKRAIFDLFDKRSCTGDHVKIRSSIRATPSNVLKAFIIRNRSGGIRSR